MFFVSISAGLQATLHNAHFRRDDGKSFTADMFLPGYKPQSQTWEQQKALAQRISQGVPAQMDPAQFAKIRESSEIYKQRAARARQLQAEGAPKEKIRAVMEGVQ